MQRFQTRRLFLKTCVLTLVTPVAFFYFLQFAFACGQILAMINLGLLLVAAPDIYSKWFPSTVQMTKVSDIAGYFVAIVASCWLLRWGWKKLAHYEDAAIRSVVQRANFLFRRRA